MNNFRRQAINHGAALDSAALGPPLDVLFRQGLELHQQGNLGAAATIYGKVIDEDPSHFDALHLLGVAAHQTGNSPGALGLIERAIGVRPDIADAHSNKSAVLMELGRTREALDSCETAIKLDPKCADAWFNAGNALAKIGHKKEAVERFQKALKLRPGYVAALTNLGSELLDLGQYEQAKKALTEAITFDPSHAKAHLNLGVAWLESGDKVLARQCFETAVKADPHYAKPWVNLSNIAYAEGSLTDAVNFANQAHQRGAQGEAGNAIGNCYRALGSPREACEAFRAAVEADPTASASHSNLLLAMLSDPSITGEQVLQEANRWAATHAPWEPQAAHPERPLKRVGFVSGDFRIHPVGFFLQPLLENLEGIEVVLYANQLEHDRQSAVLASLCTAWRPTKHLNSDELVNLVRDDQIDILIDLSGHTAEGRLDVFAKQAAPVQLTWLGYSGTTGLSQFDGIIGDNTVTPWNHEDCYSEPIIRLPDSFAPCFDISGFPEVSATPALASGRVTFGCFNATTKFNDELFEAWAAILHAVPNSVLCLKNLQLGDESVRERVSSAFQSRGIDADRIEFEGQTSREEHLAWFSRIDIALDTFPYSGATTTLDNLAMGVPVVTLMGDRYAGRMSASFLKSAGLSDLIAEDVDSYVAVAVRLAADLEGLNGLRLGMRQQLSESPLADARKFATDFHQAIRSVFESRRKAVA